VCGCAGRRTQQPCHQRAAQLAAAGPPHVWVVGRVGGPGSKRSAPLQSAAPRQQQRHPGSAPPSLEASAARSWQRAFDCLMPRDAARP
jgi:hypothetical protein